MAGGMGRSYMRKETKIPRFPLYPLGPLGPVFPSVHSQERGAGGADVGSRGPDPSVTTQQEVSLWARSFRGNLRVLGSTHWSRSPNRGGTPGS